MSLDCDIEPWTSGDVQQHWAVSQFSPIVQLECALQLRLYLFPNLIGRPLPCDLYGRQARLHWRADRLSLTSRIFP